MSGPFTANSFYSTSVNSNVGTSGKATRVFALHIISGTNGCQIVTSNGSSIDTVHPVTADTGTSNTGFSITYGDEGLFYPNGVAYVANAGDLVSVLFSYSQ